MTKREMISAITEEVRTSGYRKPVNLDKHTFHISDDDGNSKDFVVQPRVKKTLLNSDDVEAVISAFQEVLMDCVSRGDSLNIAGFGKWELRLHHGAVIRSVYSGTDVWKKSRYILKFTPSTALRECVKAYTAKACDGGTPPPEFLERLNADEGEE